MRTAFTGFVLFFVLATSTAQADVPSRLEYQGYLTDITGNAIDCSPANGCTESYTFRFALYDAPIEGNLLWTEFHDSVMIKNGIFRVALGVEEPLDPEFLTGNRWLDIQINTHPPLQPRQRLVSAPYALRASVAEQSVESENAVSLGGIPAENFVQTTDMENYLTAAELGAVLESLGYEAGPSFSGSWEDLTGVPADLNDGDDDSLAGISCASDEILKWDGSQWTCTINADTDTLSSLLCAAGELASWNGLNWSCATDQDTLSTLSCETGQVALWNGTAWTCSSTQTSQIPTSTETDCAADNVGTIYYDVPESVLMICDGSEWKKLKVCNEICPGPDAVGCALPIEDDCGSACGGLGTGLNLDQCLDPSTVTCGEPIYDDCGNLCPNGGTALDVTECTPSVTACAVAVTDNCGNSCGELGIYCAGETEACHEGSCIPGCGNNVVNPGEECDDGDDDDTNSCANDCTYNVSQGCAIKEAEHPSYTTPEMHVVLCGNTYDPGQIDEACATGWSVCTYTQWNDRYPKGSYPGGTLTSWGELQAPRYSGSWIAGAPDNGNIWDCDVGSCNNGYNPWNNGKYLYNDSKTQILQGSGSCCSWDSTFSSGSSSSMAVYCCKD